MILGKMKVLAFSHFLQGPGGTQYLADMGADIIKVEPLAGVWERHRKPAGKIPGANATHLSLNRNKRSIAIDLKHPTAKDIIFQVLEGCNVVVENYRVGVLDRLGFGYEAMKLRKPEIIYASATGWGSSGPLRDRPGQDMLVQARSGLVSASAGRPTAVGSPVVDHHGAALLAMGILAAYVRYLETGTGTRVESSLLNAGIDLQAEPILMWFAEKAKRSSYERPDNLAAWYIDAPYGVYKLSDCHIVISTGPNSGKVPEALGSEALLAFAGSGRIERRDAYVMALADELAKWSWTDVDAAFARHGIWYERVIDDYGALAEDPQVAALETFVDLPIGDQTVKLVNHPIRYDGKVCPIRKIPFEIGHDTREVLLESGFTANDVAGFIDAGIVVAPDASST